MKQPGSLIASVYHSAEFPIPLFALPFCLSFPLYVGPLSAFVCICFPRTNCAILTFLVRRHLPSSSICELVLIRSTFFVFPSSPAPGLYTPYTNMQIQESSNGVCMECLLQSYYILLYMCPHTTICVLIQVWELSNGVWNASSNATISTEQQRLVKQRKFYTKHQGFFEQQRIAQQPRRATKQLSGAYDLWSESTVTIFRKADF